MRLTFPNCFLSFFFRDIFPLLNSYPSGEVKQQKTKHRRTLKLPCVTPPAVLLFSFRFCICTPHKILNIDTKHGRSHHSKNHHFGYPCSFSGGVVAFSRWGLDVVRAEFSTLRVIWLRSGVNAGLFLGNCGDIAGFNIGPWFEDRTSLFWKKRGSELSNKF